MRAVTLLIADLGPGGAQRVLTWLANRWAEDGRDVELLTLDDGRRPPHHPLDPAVRLRPLGLVAQPTGPVAGVGRNLRRIARLAAALEHGPPGPVVSFVDTTNVLACVAAAIAGRPAVVSERTDPHLAGPGPAWSAVRPWAYRLAHTIVVQTEDARGYFGDALAGKTEVVPNPVPVPGPPVSPEDRRGVVAIGRLHREKGFDLLLDAFASVVRVRPEARLTVWGDGPEREALESHRERLGLRDVVAFPGVTPEPLARLAEARLFVLPSRVEGFPNVLCEAMAVGTPAVAFACGAGPREILDGGRAGRLVEPGDVPGLARGIVELWDDGALRRRLSREGVRSVGRFDPGSVGRRWDRIVDRASGLPPGGAGP